MLFEYCSENHQNQEVDSSRLMSILARLARKLFYFEHNQQNIRCIFADLEW